MTDIATSIFDAIDIIVDKKLQEAEFGTALVCQVIDRIDSRRCQVRYQDMIFEAEAMPSLYLQKNDIVYVLAPKNDLAAKKFIIGKTDGITPAFGTEADINSIVTSQINVVKNDVILLTERIVELEQNSGDGDGEQEVRLDYATSDDINSLFS